MRVSHSVPLILLLTGIVHARPAPLTREVAEHYYSRQAYPDALALWNGILSRSPLDPQAIARVAQLKLLTEGRSAVSAFLGEILGERGTRLRADQIQVLAREVDRVQSIFLTDEGQARYFQAVRRAAENDTTGAHLLLSEAEARERGNIRVLSMKADMEKAMEQWSAQLATLRLALSQSPWSDDLLRRTLEALVYAESYSTVLHQLALRPRYPLSDRQLTAWGVALAEERQTAKALRVLLPLIPKEPHPIVYFIVGSLLVQRRASVGEGAAYLDQFIALASNKRNTLVDGWDPYHCDRRVKRAAELVRELDTKGASRR